MLSDSAVNIFRKRDFLPLTQAPSCFFSWRWRTSTCEKKSWEAKEKKTKKQTNKENKHKEHESKIGKKEKTAAALQLFPFVFVKSTSVTEKKVSNTFLIQLHPSVTDAPETAFRQWWWWFFRPIETFFFGQCIAQKMLFSIFYTLARKEPKSLARGQI